ncbi:hypothetical protein MHYP_G00237940 [Metynnis hypsauchen]
MHSYHHSLIPSFPSLASGLCGLPLQGPLSMQVGVGTEPRHCVGLAYSNGYLGSHHTFTASCFDRQMEGANPRE